MYFYVGSKCLTYLKSKSEIADSEFARVEPLFFFLKCNAFSLRIRMVL